MTIGALGNDHPGERSLILLFLYFPKSCEVSFTNVKLEQYLALTTGQRAEARVLDQTTQRMFIPAIPLPWYAKAMAATNGRGGSSAALVWLESKLQGTRPFSSGNRSKHWPTKVNSSHTTTPDSGNQWTHFVTKNT